MLQKTKSRGQDKGLECPPSTDASAPGLLGPQLLKGKHCPALPRDEVEAKPDSLWPPSWCCPWHPHHTAWHFLPRLALRGQRTRSPRASSQEGQWVPPSRKCTSLEGNWKRAGALGGIGALGRLQDTGWDRCGVQVLVGPVLEGSESACFQLTSKAQGSSARRHSATSSHPQPCSPLLVPTGEGVWSSPQNEVW